jgi:hypothetical protein
LPVAAFSSAFELSSAWQTAPIERNAETAISYTKVLPDFDMAWVLLLVEILLLSQVPQRAFGLKIKASDPVCGRKKLTGG